MDFFGASGKERLQIGSYILTEFRKCVDSADEFKSFLRNVDKFGPPVLPGA